MCKFCEHARTNNEADMEQLGYVSTPTSEIVDLWVSVFIRADYEKRAELYISLNGKRDNEIAYDHIRINYCPICGEKFEA